MAAPECGLGCTSRCPFFLTLSVMQLFYGGQLTANYLLNREVNTLELVRGRVEGGKRENYDGKRTNASVTDLENVAGIIIETKCLILLHGYSLWKFSKR